MKKGELIAKIQKTIEEIPVFEWSKDRAIEFIREKQAEKPGEELRVTYEIAVNTTAWHIPVKNDSIDEAVERLNQLPIFEKYYLFVYTQYEHYLSDNASQNGADKNDIELLRYRIVRNVLVHNNKIVLQRDIDEFDRLAKQYNPTLTENDLMQKFNYRANAELSLLEFGPDMLLRFKNLLETVIPDEDIPE